MSFFPVAKKCTKCGKKPARMSSVPVDPRPTWGLPDRTRCEEARSVLCDGCRAKAWQQTLEGPS
jgi:hypothetical protein